MRLIIGRTGKIAAIRYCKGNSPVEAECGYVNFAVALLHHCSEQVHGNKPIIPEEGSVWSAVDDMEALIIEKYFLFL